MQDPTTGNMLEMDSKEVQERMAASMEQHDPTKTYDPEAVAKHLEAHGYCVLRQGEEMTIKGCKFTVFNFQKKRVMLETAEDIAAFKIRVGEEYNIKGGNFRVESYGKKFMCLRGLPGSRTVNGEILDEAKEKEEKAKAKMKNGGGK